MRKKYYMICSYSAILLWIVLGTTIALAGSYFSNPSYFKIINVLVGVVFIGVLLYLKFKRIMKVTINLKEVKDEQLLTSFYSLVSMEMVFILCSIFIVLIVLYAVFFRVFFEKMPVFG